MLARGAVQAGGVGSEGPRGRGGAGGGGVLLSKCAVWSHQCPKLVSTPASGLPLFGAWESTVMTVGTTSHFYQELLETMEIAEGGCGGVELLSWQLGLRKNGCISGRGLFSADVCHCHVGPGVSR